MPTVWAGMRRKLARVGMRHLVFATIASETTGSNITYGTGTLLGRAVRGNVQWERNDNPLYGDDVVAENDNGVTGYTLDIEMTELEEEAQAAVLGLTKTGTDEKEYSTTDDNAPYGGCGYIQVLRRKGVTVYKALWYHKLQFGIESEETRTRGRNIEWGTPTLTGTGMGAYLDSTGKAHYRKEKVFTSEADAIAYLDGLANIGK